MSQATVEYMQQVCDALNRGDQARLEVLLRERLDPSFEFHPLAPGNVRRGFSGIQEFFEDMQEVWEEYTQEVEEMIDAGDEVVVVLRIRARATGSGVPVAQRSFWVWSFRGGKAVRATSFESRIEALEAAGPLG